MPNSVDRLVEIFTRFPGVGPRQARRFVYFLLREPKQTSKELASLISLLESEVNQCQSCLRYFTKKVNLGKLCDICSDQNREKSLLMVVEKDADLEAVEKAGVYRGKYFVLGGLLAPLDKNPEQRIRLFKLKDAIAERKRENLKEVVFALSANIEGDHTVEFLKEKLENSLSDIKTTVLGRGLSTGTELEYSDRDTLLYALKNRG